MGRTKTFDPEIKLELALDLFWKKGYDGTSLSDLLQHLEISRQSLYDTFGDKHELYVKSIDYYLKNTYKMMEITLLSPDAGLDTIKDMFKMYLDNTALNPEKKSCFMANAALELALDDKIVENKVNEFFSLAEEGFRHALKNAVKKGEINSKKNIDDLASYLTSSMMGVGILTKSGTSDDKIESIFDIVLSTLTSS